jgi:hypothetical protein
MTSFRSLGTSEKKKTAKKPVTAPKPPRVNPLFSRLAYLSYDIVCLGLFVEIEEAGCRIYVGTSGGW